jgi:hypothetical protein
MTRSEDRAGTSTLPSYVAADHDASELCHRIAIRKSMQSSLLPFIAFDWCCQLFQAEVALGESLIKRAGVSLFII